MNRIGSRHQRVPTPSTGNRDGMALQINEGKYGHSNWVELSYSRVLSSRCGEQVRCIFFR